MKMKLSPESILVLGILVTFVTSTFVTKVNNGLEHIVISVEDALASASPQVSSTSSPFGSTTEGTTHDCQTILESLKVIKTLKKSWQIPQLFNIFPPVRHL